MPNNGLICKLDAVRYECFEVLSPNRDAHTTVTRYVCPSVLMSVCGRRQLGDIRVMD